MIVATLDLYFKGVSLRKIADHLKQFYGLDIDHSTVYRWISKYTDIIEAYVKTLEPEVGDIWHTDEMKIMFSGEWRWLWNVMDEKTRFHLVSIISETSTTRLKQVRRYTRVDYASGWCYLQADPRPWMLIQLQRLGRCPPDPLWGEHFR